MNRVMKLLLAPVILMSASQAIAEGSPHDGGNWRAKREAKFEDVVASAEDSTGNVTKQSLETAMQNEAKLRADMLFGKVSNGDSQVTASQLMDFAQNHEGHHERHEINE